MTSGQAGGRVEAPNHVKRLSRALTRVLVVQHGAGVELCGGGRSSWPGGEAAGRPARCPACRRVAAPPGCPPWPPAPPTRAAPPARWGCRACAPPRRRRSWRCAPRRLRGRGWDAAAGAGASGELCARRGGPQQAPSSRTSKHPTRATQQVRGPSSTRRSQLCRRPPEDTMMSWGRGSRYARMPACSSSLKGPGA